MRFGVILLVSFTITLAGFSQQVDTLVLNKKSIGAFRIENSPKIDGVLDEDLWRNATIATDFIQLEPRPGKKASQKTEVRVLYNDYALYVGAILYDVSKDSILRQFSQRDNEENTDVFGLYLDTYNDDQNGYGFEVHPTGVQVDRRFTVEEDDVDYDDEEVSWDAVWKSAVTMDDKNWYVEMEIPYSAIRFPKKEVQAWGINFVRKIRRNREFSFWSPISPLINGTMVQNGDLTELKNIEPPLRLSLTPYVSGYMEHSTENKWDGLFRGGMDLKYGFNEAFTLDMTLIPDFGQVQSDNKVLNLTPYEVQYDERRPFFMEGNELFNKAGMMFYSRRMGGDVYQEYEAQEGETIKENHTESQLLNVSKITGRTTKGLGIGMINGITNELHSTIQDATGKERQEMVDPLTNYNTLVLDQNLKNNSSVTLMNTNVARSGSFHDANVSALAFDLNNKKNVWNFNGYSSVSKLKYGDSTDVGLAYGYGIEKTSGRYTFGVSNETIGDTYEANDMGYVEQNNISEYMAFVEYNMYEPRKKIQNYQASLEYKYHRLVNPNIYTYMNVELYQRITFRNYLTIGSMLEIYTKGTDYFEPRVWGRYYMWPMVIEMKSFISSDYRKKFAFDLWGGYSAYAVPNRYSYDFTPRIRLRINDKFNIKHQTEFEYNINYEGAAIDIEGYNTILPNPIDPTIEDIIFGIRDQRTIENILNAEYIFTNRMGITIRLRHYWATVKYDSFHVLGEQGDLLPSDFDGLDNNGNSLYNTNYNALNLNLAYRWVFLPGSELSIVWKNAIYSSNDKVASSYLNNLGDVLSSPQTNSISIKMLYYLDYMNIKRAVKKKKRKK